MVNPLSVRPRGACIAALLLATLAAGPVGASFTEEVGFATALDDGRPLYREQHLMRAAPDGGPLERLVVYRCTDGTPFARKRVDYRGAPSAPAFQFEDARSGYREGLKRGRGGAQVFVDRPDAEPRQATLPDGAFVADAGFDQWVRGHWPALARGERVPMDFLVPSRLTSYAFKVYQVEAPAEDGEPARRFRLRLGGLLGWLAPHIDVVYAEADRRLLRFEGLSNLRDDAGEDPLTVRIEFPKPARPVASGDFERLAAEPLRPCRVGA